MHSPMTDDVRRLEDEIAKLKARLSQLRRNSPRTTVADYEFRRADGTAVRLSELFGGKSDLLIIHNMGSSCPYCTLWADGFSGIAHHLASRSGLALVSPDEPERLAPFAAGRGWRFQVVSGRETTFTRDIGFEPEPGKCWPGASGFRLSANGVITLVASATFGPGDAFCSAWHLFDLLADGANGWQPRYSY